MCERAYEFLSAKIRFTDGLLYHNLVKINTYLGGKNEVKTNV